MERVRTLEVIVIVDSRRLESRHRGQLKRVTLLVAFSVHGVVHGVVHGAIHVDGVAVPEASGVYGTIHADGVAVAPAAERPDGPDPVFGSLQLFTDDSLARGEVYKGVPDSLQRQHTATGNAELEVDAALRGEAVEPIDGTRDPGDQNGKTKDEAGTEVGHLDGIQSLELRGGARLDILQPRNDCRYHAVSLGRSGCTRRPRQSLRIRSVIASCLSCCPRLAVSLGSGTVQVGAKRIHRRRHHGKSQSIILLRSAGSDLDFSGRSTIIIVSLSEALRNQSACCICPSTLCQKAYLHSRITGITGRTRVGPFVSDLEGKCKLAKTVPMVEDPISYGDVDDDGSKNADPDGDIVRIEAN